jgi:hypothetical protein
MVIIFLAIFTALIPMAFSYLSSLMQAISSDTQGMSATFSSARASILSFFHLLIGTVVGIAISALLLYLVIICVKIGFRKIKELGA